MMKAITEITYVTNWYSQNYLDQNVTKTKELIFNFRRKQTIKAPIVINDKAVDLSTSYTYLGCTIKDDLKWDIQIKQQMKKASKRMYHVRWLRNLHVDSNIISMFYNATVSSILTYVIPSMFNASSVKQKEELNKLRKKVCKMVNLECCNVIEDPKLVCDTKSIYPR